MKVLKRRLNHEIDLVLCLSFFLFLRAALTREINRATGSAAGTLINRNVNRAPIALFLRLQKTKSDDRSIVITFLGRVMSKANGRSERVITSARTRGNFCP